MYSLPSYPSLAICLCLLAYSDEITAQLTVYFLTALREFPYPLICSCIHPRCQLDSLFSILSNSLVTRSGNQHIEMEILPRKCSHKHVWSLSYGRIFLIQFRRIRIYIIKNASVFLFSNQESEITEFFDVWFWSSESLLLRPIANQSSTFPCAGKTQDGFVFYENSSQNSWLIIIIFS